jgi:hypothetical protein
MDEPSMANDAVHTMTSTIFVIPVSPSFSGRAAIPGNVGCYRLPSLQRIVGSPSDIAMGR